MPVQLQTWVKIVLATSLLLAGPSRAAAMGLGNASPTVTSVAVSPQPVPAGGSASVACSAADDSGIGRLVVSVSGGTLPGGGASAAVAYAAPSRTVSEQLAWATPGPGTYTVTCAVTDVGGGFGGPLTTTSSITVQTVAQTNPPGVDAVTASAPSVFPGETVELTAIAHGDGLSFTWTAAGGTLASAGSGATWTAPDASGTYQVAVAATDSLGRTATGAASIQVVLARAAAPAELEGSLPARLAVDAAGSTYVAEPGAGRISVLAADGRLLRRLEVGGTPAAVAVSRGGEVFVADAVAGRVTVHDGSGRRVRALGRGEAELAGPIALALHPVTGRVFVADSGAAAIRVFEPTGAPAGVIPFPGGRPVGLAFDLAGGRLFVTDASAGQVRVFDAAGALVRTIGAYGAPLVRAAGVSVGADGQVYVVDSYQSRVAVFSPAGVHVGYVGEYGSADGQLQVPLDVAVDAPRGRVLVTNTQLARVERFALRAAIGCAGDTDCDGLPDAWELARGTDPYVDDALADPDGDGLTNLEELRRGTDPRLADTDGDGVQDGDEVLAGLDPLASDRPTLVTAAGRESAPGLVRISASLRSAVPCTTAWRRVAGAEVALRDAQSLAPSFVAREGTVTLEGVATCGPVQSAPVTTTVAIRNVAPRPDAGRLLVAAPGSAFVLDAGFSSDANGGVLAFSWDQTLGRPVAGATSGGALLLDAAAPGLYRFQLTATDPEGEEATAEVPVLVAAGPVSTAVAAASPEEVAAGGAVRLDASASVLAGEGARILWEQVEGPAPATLRGEGAVARATPRVPGRYAFAASVVQGARRSPPARVEVYVSAAGAALPAVATAAADAPVVAVGAPVTLAATGTGPEFAWRQVSGPAAGLTDADRASATAVPFAPGFHVFEVVAKDGTGAESRPARVTFEARAGGAPIPVARPAAPAQGEVGQPVVLDGRGSAGATGWRWTQLAGPWVAIDGHAAVVTFRPRTPGSYTFELEVDDGTTRSAPASVTVVVGRARADRD